MDKIRIAICDDEKNDLGQIMEQLKLYDPDNQLLVSTFHHAADLLDAAKKLSFDIVLLDIEMEPPSKLVESIPVIQQNLARIKAVSASQETVGTLRSMLNTLFTLDLN